MSYFVLVPRINRVSLPWDDDPAALWRERDRIVEWIEERGLVLDDADFCHHHDAPEGSVHCARTPVPAFRPAWCVRFRDEAHAAIFKLGWS